MPGTECVEGAAEGYMGMFRSLVMMAGLLAAMAAPVALAAPHTGKKILLIDSYNDDYRWSRDVTRAATKIIEPTGAELRVVRMDTKNKPSEEHKIAISLEIKALIRSYRPDVIIACDDNASKYVIAPYFRNSDIPVVFCGINWNAAQYGFPTHNITGILEINSFREILKILKASGGNTENIGVLSVDNESDRADMLGAEITLGLHFTNKHYVKNFSDWKTTYADLQNKVDLLVIHNHVGIAGWNDAEASAFIAKNTKVLTASVVEWMAPFAAVNFAKLGAEQGRWAAETAVQILNGAKPSDIPVAHNKEDILILNAKVARLSKFPVPPVYFNAAAQVLE